MGWKWNGKRIENINAKWNGNGMEMEWKKITTPTWK